VPALIAALPLAAAPQLKYAVVISRHGVRSPTWDSERLNEYSAQPWPAWGVAPGELTPHGRALIKLMAAYYGGWFTKEHLLGAPGCRDVNRVSIIADTSQRTIETGRAFGESLIPGCKIDIQSQRQDQKDPLFSGVGTPDPELSRSAVLTRLGSDPQKLIADHHAAIDALQFVLFGDRSVPRKLVEANAEIGVAISGKSIELSGPFSIGSTLSENLLLEYTNGFQGADLGWGRLNRESLLKALELHAVYADLMRRTKYLARARGSNLLAHVLLSMEQAESGQTISGALGGAGDSLLILSGHDTNLSNLSGMLDLTWKLPGYQPDDTPPGGALIFLLWRDGAQEWVTARYVAQSLDQMRNGDRLTLAAPPLSADVKILGCMPEPAGSGCSWANFGMAVRKATDPAFVAPR
jgi:4-phytase/acid phosphatase